MKSILLLVLVGVVSPQSNGRVLNDHPMLRKDLVTLTARCSELALGQITDQVGVGLGPMGYSEATFIHDGNYELYSYFFSFRILKPDESPINVLNILQKKETVFEGNLQDSTVFKLYLGKGQRIPTLKFKESWVKKGYDQFGNEDSNMDEIQKFLLEIPKSHGNQVPLLNVKTGAPSKLTLDTLQIENCLLDQ